MLETSRGWHRVVANDAIERGLAKAVWPARLELIDFPNTDRQVLIDAAHNPDGAEALALATSRAGIRNGLPWSSA